MTDESLWKFAVEFYAHPRVESLCLRLQDRHGININLLLWSLWLDRCGVVFEEGFWVSSVSEIDAMHQDVVRWRGLRKATPKWWWLRLLRDLIKRRELTLEMRELNRLEQCYNGWCGRGVADESSLSRAYVLRCLAKINHCDEDWKSVEELLLVERATD